jgi:hypothetical protein
MTPPFPNTPSDSPTTVNTSEYDDPRDVPAQSPGPAVTVRAPTRARSTGVPGRSSSTVSEQSAGRAPGGAPPSGATARPASDVAARDIRTPEPVLEHLALSAIEVIAGARDLEQLGRWVTREVCEHLSIRVTIASRARRVRGAVGKRPVILGTRVSAFRTAQTVVDGVVTVTMRDRTRAVALRIEWEGGRWRASAIHVL